MLCASATLVQSHEKRRQKERGLEGRKRGEDAAAPDAAGAALGSMGLVAFAAAILAGDKEAPWVNLVLASVVWVATATYCWWIYKRRIVRG
jgi:hypothetical protein